MYIVLCFDTKRRFYVSLFRALSPTNAPSPLDNFYDDPKTREPSGNTAQNSNPKLQTSDISCQTLGYSNGHSINRPTVTLIWNISPIGRFRSARLWAIVSQNAETFSCYTRSPAHFSGVNEICTTPAPLCFAFVCRNQVRQSEVIIHLIPPRSRGPWATRRNCVQRPLLNVAWLSFPRSPPVPSSGRRCGRRSFLVALSDGRFLLSTLLEVAPNGRYKCLQFVIFPGFLCLDRAMFSSNAK